MRLVEPNCMGVINTDPQVNMNATFSPIYPPQGNVAFLSQNGAMGLVILDYALIEDLPQIAELDLNPVKVLPRGEGYWVVDARILVR